MDDQVVAMLRGNLLEICINTAFVAIGVASCAIAALRRRRGMRILLWTGVWSAVYGVLHLLGVKAVQVALPDWLRAATPYVTTSIEYLLVVVASCAWLELIVGAMRRVVIGFVVAATITGVLGIGWYIVTGVNDKFMFVNNMLAAGILCVLLVTITSRRLSEKYLLLPNRGFLVFGTLVFALEALAANLSRPLFGRGMPILVDHLGFLVQLVAFGYSGLRMVGLKEHQLVEIQAELEVARQIQTSILPTEVPRVRGLTVSATYRPMASVAGDFYEFLQVDDEHAGFFVADVCGHGVPAALIASMLKVAVRSVAANADSPGEFLSAINRVLAEPLRGQLVSASYLWIDMRTRRGLYSAAGHPPLLCCNHSVEEIESNGLLFGILPEVEYPVRELALGSGDRLLLYTDGVTEPENRAGQAFGEGRLPWLLAESRAESPDELAQKIVAEVQEWQGSADPQDDMTLIVIDVG